MNSFTSSQGYSIPSHCYHPVTTPWHTAFISSSELIQCYDIFRLYCLPYIFLSIASLPGVYVSCKHRAYFLNFVFFSFIILKHIPLNQRLSSSKLIRYSPFPCTPKLIAADSIYWYTIFLIIYDISHQGQLIYKCSFFSSTISPYLPLLNVILECFSLFSNCPNVFCTFLLSKVYLRQSVKAMKQFRSINNFRHWLH